MKKLIKSLFMKVWTIIIFFCIIISNTLYGQTINNTVYINPDYTGGSNDGTITHPYTSLLNATITNNTAYLINRGTTDVFNDSDDILVVAQLHDIVIGAYGTGDRPVIYSDASDGSRAILEFRGCNNILFDGLHISGSSWVDGINQVAAAIMVQEYYTHLPSHDIEINNCILEHTGWGIRAWGISGSECYNYTVDSCVIRNIEDDGIYFNWVENIEISYSNIHDVNLKWDHEPNGHISQDVAGGDCIQIARRGVYSHIHHNILDRSNSGHKFCLAFTDASYGTNTALIEYNTFVSPRGDGEGGSTLYLEELEAPITRYNTFTNGHGVPQMGGIYVGANCDDNQVYYNIFDSLSYAFKGHTVTSDTTWFYNNVIYDMDAEIRGQVFYSKNNIYDGITNGGEYENGTWTLVEDYNCYTSGYSGTNSITSDPLFVDPDNFDFRLQPGSPVIAEGINVGLTVDKNGTLVEDPPEIGAYQFVPTGGYYLTVNNGTGDGSYTENTIVTIVADTPGNGQAFDQWTGDVQFVNNPSDANTSVTMPAQDVTVTATYTSVPTYTLTVINGSGDGSYIQNEVVSISANTPPTGQQFDQWTGDIQFLNNSSSANTTVAMPAQDVTVTATYISFPTYTLTVVNGSGDGSYAQNDVVSISANTPPANQQFDQWVGDVQYVDNIYAENTSVTMPASNVAVTATYIDIQFYDLIVNSGSGDGTYPENTVVNIVADDAPTSYTFYQWTGDIATVSDVNSPNTQITIPANNVSVTATYTITDTYFVDPENANDPLEDGSITHPFDSWEDVSFSSNTTYLQKRGTICYTDQYFFNTYRSNVVLSAYGIGDRPTIISSSANGSRAIIEFAYSYNIRIENLHISGIPYQSGVSQPAACIMVGNTNTHNIIIRNCELENAAWGIRAFNGDDILIAGCEIHNIEDDGMFIQNCTNSEISYNEIHDINLKWFHVGHLESQSPGDCIQLSNNCDGFYVHHNILDRSNSGNKFCFTQSSSVPTDYINGIFERNQCISPLPDGDGAASLFLGSQGHDIIIRYNTFEGSTGGIYANSDDLRVYYNTFNGLSYGVWGMSESDTINVINNMFYNMDPELKGVNMVVKNNIFDLLTDDGALDLVANLDESHNLYTLGIGGNNSIVGDPLMVDPENGDFHLLDNSPCIDYGLDLGYLIDHDSLTVPYGVCPELGSYEFYGVQTINQPPNIASQSFSVLENLPNGQFVCHIEASDPDGSQTISYTILAGNTDNAFTINSVTGDITVNNQTALNYEVNPIFILEVEVIDDWTIPLSSSATMTIDLIDVNEAPSINSASFAIDENTPENTFVGHVVASDPDNGQSLSYSILSGNIDNAFQIGVSNGNITVQNSSALNFENWDTFTLLVKVEDNGQGPLFDIATITVNITDVNEDPEMDDATYILAENSLENTLVGQLLAWDPDNGQSLTFSIITGNIDNAFQINSETGEINVQNTEMINYEVWQSFNLLVKVEDDGLGNLFDVANVTINITDINEAPVVEDQLFSIPENTPSGQQVDIILASDPDNGQQLSFTIVGGNSSNAFEIDEFTGMLSVMNADAINFELNPAFTLIVEVEDDGAGNLTDQAVIIINLADINENPIVEDQELSVVIYEIDENILVGDVMAFDPDQGQTISYTILEDELGAFSIDPTYGRLIITNLYLIIEDPGTVFDILVSVVDNSSAGLKDDAIITIDVDLTDLITGVGDSPNITDELLLNIYPNPTHGKLNVEVVNMASASDGEILITDLQGAQVLKENIALNKEFNSELDLTGIAPGIYFIHVLSEKTIITRKFIVR